MEPKVLRSPARPGFLLSAAILALFLAVAPRAVALNTFSTGIPAPSLVNTLIASMSDSELLGQVFLLGYSGTTATPPILEWIRKHDLGGVVVFGWNATNLTDLTRSIAEMQRTAHATKLQIPLLIGTDQEGGWVHHVGGDTSMTPGNMAIGATRLPAEAYKTGYYIGRELKALGINMDFAPDSDVLTNVHADVIGPRSFGSNPVEVGLLSEAFYRGLTDVGVISVAKHFPGHGDANVDSHIALPIIPGNFQTIWNRDLVPFRFLVKDGIPAIMVGHLAFPGITGRVWPATLSHYFMTTLLREKMGFQGVVITDDLLMNGVLDTGLSLPAICHAALEAGDDMLMISETPSLDSAVWMTLLEDMHRDPHFREIVRNAARRVLMLKAAYLRGPNAVPLEPTVAGEKRVLPDKPAEAYFFQQACRSVTPIKGNGIPLKDLRDKRILLIGQFKQFLEAGKRRFPTADTLKIHYYPFYWATKAELDSVRSIADHYDIVIFCLANPNSMEVLQSLKDTRAKIIVMSALSPVYLRGEPWVDSALAVYGEDIDSFTCGFAALAGDFTPTGRLPIDLLNGVFR